MVNKRFRCHPADDLLAAGPAARGFQCNPELWRDRRHRIIALCSVVGRDWRILSKRDDESNRDKDLPQFDAEFVR